MSSRSIAGRVLRALAVLLGIAVLGLLWLHHARRADPKVQRVLDYYAPGLVIGDRVGEELRSRYRLRPAPYMGLSDSLYEGPDGVRGLGVFVDEYVDDGNPRVSASARAESVNFGLPTRAVLARVVARVTRELGRPERDFCYSTRGMKPKMLHHMLVWPEARGKSVIVGGRPNAWWPSATAATDSIPAAVSWLALHVDPPAREYQVIEQCPSAP